jgi:outer membrane protein assembly factor BamB
MGRSASVLRRTSVLFLLFSTPVPSADWPTFAHDPQRSGWAVDEDTLKPENVAGLELKWRVQVKNEPRSLTALTAPVVASEVTTPQGVKTVVYVAGSADNLSALDAQNGGVIWSRTFESHVLPKNEGMWLCPNGINATPTIDRSKGVIYTIAVDGSLYGLDLGTGKIKLGPVQFVPPFSKNWSLNLVDGIVYTSISQGCGGARSGIYSMDLRDSARLVIRDLLTSSRGGAGIWGRGGPVAGASDRIYASTGDGEFDPPQGLFGSTYIAASARDLEVVDYFAPVNYKRVTQYDLDMASASPVWLSYRNFNLLAGGGKEGVLYLLDADALGDKDHQTPLFTMKLANDDGEFEGKGIWGAVSMWRDEKGQAWVSVPIYGPVSKEAPKFPQTNGVNPHGSIMTFKVAVDDASRKPALEPAWISGDFNLPDPVVIANGVVFALSTGENPQQTQGPTVVYAGQKTLTDAERAQNTKNAVLYALDAKTGKVLYQSGRTIGAWVHFSGLAVADGRVYAVDHESRVYCFGLKGK